MRAFAKNRAQIRVGTRHFVVAVLLGLALSGCMKSGQLASGSCASADCTITGSIGNPGIVTASDDPYAITPADGNPRLEAARESVSVAEEDIVKARAANGPTLDIVANSDWEEGNAGRGGSQTDLDTDSQSAGFSARLPITDALFGRPRVRSARASADSASHRFRSTEEELLLEFARLQSQIERDRRVLKAITGHTKRLDALYQEARQRKATGDISETDLNQIRARTIAAKVDRAETEASLNENLAQLPTVLGQVGEANLADISRLIPGSVNVAISSALNFNPELNAARKDLAAAEADVIDARRENLPDVNLTATASRDWDDTSRGGSDNLFVGINVAVPLYDGGNRNATIRQRKATSRERDYQVKTIERSVVANIKGDWARREAARVQLELTKSRTSSSRAALSGVREARRVGARLIEDELSALSDLLSAEVSGHDARRDLIQSEHRIAAQIGRLAAAYKVN